MAKEEVFTRARTGVSLVQELVNPFSVEEKSELGENLLRGASDSLQQLRNFAIGDERFHLTQQERLVAIAAARLVPWYVALTSGSPAVSEQIYRLQIRPLEDEFLILSSGLDWR